MRVFAGVCAIAAAGIGVVAAEEYYVNAKLAGGFSLDIPNVVGETYQPPAGGPADLLMRFEVTLGEPGTMSCAFRRFPYDKDLARDDLVAGLAKGNAGYFCKANGPDISEYELSDSEASTADGLPAGTCAAAYTDVSGEQTGKVVSMKVIAGKKAAYQLICVSEDDDKNEAVVAYATRWLAVESHMQESLKMPDEEK